MEKSEIIKTRGAKKFACARHKYARFVQILIHIQDILNVIQANMNQGLYSCGVFIDLNKAFDTIDHNIVLRINSTSTGFVD